MLDPPIRSFFPFFGTENMNLSRQVNSRQKTRGKPGKRDDKEKIPTLDQFIGTRNYIGAITLLEVCLHL